VLKFVLEPVAGLECRRRFSHLGRGDYSYDDELYAFAKNIRFCLNSEISFEVSFGASPLVTLVHGNNL
jgi:hypothetical protein